jgi:hypothetical protein
MTFSEMRAKLLFENIDVCNNNDGKSHSNNRSNWKAEDMRLQAPPG